MWLVIICFCLALWAKSLQSAGAASAQMWELLNWLLGTSSSTQTARCFIYSQSLAPVWKWRRSLVCCPCWPDQIYLWPSVPHHIWLHWRRNLKSGLLSLRAFQEPVQFSCGPNYTFLKFQTTEGHVYARSCTHFLLSSLKAEFTRSIDFLSFFKTICRTPPWCFKILIRSASFGAALIGIIC